MVAGGKLLSEVLLPGYALQSPSTGQRYVLQRHLGEGAHGQVWLSTDSAGSEKALKVVVPVAHCDKQAELMASEISRAQAASEFVRELVPRFHEAFSVERTDPAGSQNISLLVIVMEYIDGYSLDAIVARHPLPEAHVSIVLRSICLALQRLHERGTIHRDVKGANVMVSASGRVYLCDFGVSKWLEQAADQASTVAGSPYWMAPEVVKGAQPGRRRGYGFAVDVWSVGVTAIELVEGCPPLAKNVLCRVNPYHVFHLVAKESPPRLGPSHSLLLRGFVARCLVKNPAQRATLRELLEEPHGFLQPFPNSQQMLRDVIAYMRTGDCGLGQVVEVAPAAHPKLADWDKLPGYATLTFQELSRSLAIAPAPPLLLPRPGPDGELGEWSSGEESAPAECTLGPLERRPLRDLVVQRPGAWLHLAAGRPGNVGPPGGCGQPAVRPGPALPRPCPSSPPPTPQATLSQPRLCPAGHSGPLPWPRTTAT